MLDYRNSNNQSGHLLFKSSAITWWGTANAADFTVLIPFTCNHQTAADFQNTTIKTLACGYTASAQSWYVFIRQESASDNAGFRVGLVIGDGSTTDTVFIQAFHSASPENDLYDLYHKVCCAAFLYDASEKKGKVLLAIETGAGQTTAWETAWSAALASAMLTPTAVTIGGQSTSGAIAAPSNIRPQRLAIGPMVAYSGVLMTLADLQTLVDYKDMGAFQVAHTFTGGAALASMSGATLGWIGNSCQYPTVGGSNVFVDGGAAASVLGDPAAVINTAGVCVYTTDEWDTKPTSGDVTTGAAANVVRPTSVGFTRNTGLVAACGGSTAANVAARAGNTYKFARGTMDPGLILVSGNSRANRTNVAAKPTSLAFFGESQASAVSLLPSSGLTYTSDYASKEGGTLAATFAAGLAYSAAARARSVLVGGFAGSQRKAATHEGPFTGRAQNANYVSGCRSLNTGSSAYPSSEVANIADWNRLTWSGGVGDSGAGAGLGRGVYMDPGGTDAIEMCFHPMIGRDPADPLTVLVVLVEGPGLSTDVDVIKGYRDNADAWQADSTAHEAVDLSTETYGALVNAYTAGTKTITLKSADSGATIRPGEAFAWRRGSTAYYGVGVHTGASQTESGGAITITSEHVLGGTWVSGGNQGFPKSDDAVFIGPVGYRVLEVTFSAAELHATTGDIDNNAPGVRIVNNDANRPCIIERIIPITGKTGCATFVQMGQSGAGYDDWNGAGTSSNKRNFDTAFNGGGVATTPLGQYLAALGSHLKAWWFKGAQQTSSTASMLRLLAICKAAAPACDRVVIADPTLPLENSDTYDDLSFNGNATYWEAHRTAIIGADDGCAVVMDTLRTHGHPATLQADGALIDNQHWTQIGAQLLGGDIIAELADDTVIMPAAVATGGLRSRNRNRGRVMV